VPIAPKLLLLEPKFILLDKGQKTLVDAIDFEWLSHYNWYAEWKKEYKDGAWVVKASIRGKLGPTSMSRFILNVTDPELLIDHIDHNTLNHRRQNLRIVTRSQNQQNRRKPRNNSSGYKGVHRRITKKGEVVWVARIAVSGIRHELGWFSTVAEAAEAYHVAAIKFHGEYACFK